MQTLQAWSPPLSQVAPQSRTMPIVLAISLNVLFVYGLGVGLHVIPTFSSKPIPEMVFVPTEEKIVHDDDMVETAQPKIGPSAFDYVADEPRIDIDREIILPPEKEGPIGKPRDVIEPPAFTASVPRILSSSEPPYPNFARLHNEEGVVYVRVMVSPRGEVVGTQLEKSSGYTRLDEAALKAVRGWRFSPSLRGTQAIAGSTVVLVRFRLQE